MTWLVLPDRTQKIHSVSKIHTTFNPKQQNFTLDPISTTEFELMDNNPSVPEALSVDPTDDIFLNHD